eukprot:TRINITY_DN9974_c1_g2_i2.p1 TRINITY_DN9974_c1_g2~~TRINITY_DN9974_c1_g2_i2.p1  ORF type:complete len:108 (+),score=31.46 TRINITY_DN9974_c1_g2_i2:55-378(+)
MLFESGIQQPMSAAVTGGVPSYTQPNFFTSSQAYEAMSPLPQYSFMALAEAQTSVQPVTKSFGGTEPPSFFFVSNMPTQASSEKLGPAAALVARTTATAAARRNMAS